MCLLSSEMILPIGLVFGRVDPKEAYQLFSIISLAAIINNILLLGWSISLLTFSGL